MLTLRERTRSPASLLPQRRQDELCLPG